MKRLKNILLALEPNTTTFKELYDGKLHMHSDYNEDPYNVDEPIFWKDDIFYEISRSNKLRLDCPTVVIGIPVRILKLEALDVITADYCLRSFNKEVDQYNLELCNPSRTDVENGKYYSYHPNNKVVLRNCCCFKEQSPKYYIDLPGNSGQIIRPYPPAEMFLQIMLQVQFPYRKIRKTIQMLTRDLPDMVDTFLRKFDKAELATCRNLARKQEEIRGFLAKSEYCAFIANGSILPRDKDGEAPLAGAYPFFSTPNDEIEVAGVKGMGIRKGVTVITGCGYSGKSTLLDAISEGVYNHCIGDGRELVITDESAMKISAEDGRKVSNVNISPFIQWLPHGDTTSFSTEHASGSTSQAANIIEAVKFNSKLLLIDEDKSATNFMIRDQMMKELIQKEPITPFTDRVNELYEICKVSTILVIGGSGEYLSIADSIYCMEDYKISDVTLQAKNISRKYHAGSERIQPAAWNQPLVMYLNHFTTYPKNSGKEKLEASDLGFLFFGDKRIDIRMLHNIESFAQLNAMGYIIRRLSQKRTLEIEKTADLLDESMMEDKDQLVLEDNREEESESSKCGCEERQQDNAESNEEESFTQLELLVDQLLDELNDKGLEEVFSNYFTKNSRWLEMPRRYEILAAISRM